MSVQATPQRHPTENDIGKSPKSPKSPRSPRSPKTPRKSLTPLTKHAIEMSTTPIRNRLLLTPTKNKQRQVYDPLDDLRLLGRLFNTKSKSKLKPKTIGVGPSSISTSTANIKKFSSPITSNTNLDTYDTREYSDMEMDEEKEITPNVTENSMNNSILNSITNLRPNHQPEGQNILASPTPEMRNVPSFINRDVRSFARIFHDQSSSFNTNLHTTSIMVSDSSGLLEDTLQLTQSQSQSQSQSQPPQPQLHSHQQDLPEPERIPYNDEIPDFGDNNYMGSDFTEDNEVGRYNETFESHADTSNIAIPEAILRDGSGILGMSDDEIEEYNMSLSKLNASDSSEESESIDDDDDDDTEINNMTKDLSLIMQHEQFITKRKTNKRRGNISANGSRITRDARFSNKMIKGLLENLQLGDVIGRSGIDMDLFNELSYKFIDMELAKSIEMSEFTGLKNRIVYTDVIRDGNNDGSGGDFTENEEETMLLYAMHNWDIETVKELEGVLYSNKTMRKRRADYTILKEKQAEKVAEAERIDEIEGRNEQEKEEDEENREPSDNKGGEESSEVEEEEDGNFVDLNNLKSHITVGISEYNNSDDSEGSSDYEIPMAEEESEDE